VKRTKIVATIGPASESKKALTKMIESGMNVARLNFSHGTHEMHGSVVDSVRSIDRTIGILLDTQGPKIRTGKFDGEVIFKEGATVSIKNQDIIGNSKEFSIDYKDLHKGAKKGRRIVLNDGAVELIIIKVVGDCIICKVKNSGIVSSHKGVNLPNWDITIPSLTEKDKKDIKFGISKKVDFIAYSFVRTAEDIKKLRDYLKKIDTKNIDIVAKIETAEAVENLEEIITASDGVMIARGDLAVEIELEKVPTVQRKVIELCAKHNKYSIVATEMLQSMSESPRPTRAEISDVANAVFQGTDAVMLSGETTVGKYPIQTVETMGRILFEAETDMKEAQNMKEAIITTKDEEIALNSVRASGDLGIGAILIPTKTGHSAKLVSRYRPKAKVFALVPSEQILRKMSILYGIEGIIADYSKTTLEVVKETARKLVKEDKLDPSESVVIVGEYRSDEANMQIIIEAKRLLPP
jgi:pyruvate kinase